MTVSTHILDAVAGRPAVGVSVALTMRDTGGSWLPVEEGVTDADGRIRFGAETASGVYRLTFGTGPYFADRGIVDVLPRGRHHLQHRHFRGCPGSLPRAAAALPVLVLDVPGQLAVFSPDAWSRRAMATVGRSVMTTSARPSDSQ